MKHVNTSIYSFSKTFLLVMALFSLAACNTFGGGKKEELAYIERPAELIYNQGFEEIESGDWERAKLLFEEVERQHPFSKWARRALLMSAYSDYRDANYETSIATAERFLSLHPGSESAPYAYYLIGINYYDQIYDIGRDQQTTVNAENALQQVVRRYPETDYGRDAALKLELTHDHLAGKEMSVGRFYQKQNQQLAAISRFKTVVRDYDTTTHVEEAMHRLVESYITLGVIDEARKVASVLGYNYPSGEWYSDSYKLLAKHGLDIDQDIRETKEPGYWRRLRERLF